MKIRASRYERGETTIARQVAAFYALPGNDCGGVLHIVTDDDNIETHHVQWCLDEASAAGDIAGRALALRLLAASFLMRRRVVRRFWGRTVIGAWGQPRRPWAPRTLRGPVVRFG